MNINQSYKIKNNNMIYIIEETRRTKEGNKIKRRVLISGRQKYPTLEYKSKRK